MMNCFCGMVDRRQAFSLISRPDHCQRSSPSRISDTLRTGFEPVQNLSSGLVEWSCAVVITTTPQCHSYLSSWAHFDLSLDIFFLPMVVFFFVPPYLLVAVQPCLEWIHVKQTALAYLTLTETIANIKISIKKCLYLQKNIKNPHKNYW